MTNLLCSSKHSQEVLAGNLLQITFTVTSPDQLSKQVWIL